MSKTETQSDALQLAEFFGSMKKSSHRWYDGVPVHEKAAAELRRLDAENKALRARLEAQAAALAAPSAGWISVDAALPPKNTEVAIWFAESTIPSTGQYTGLRADPNGWSYPSENYLSPGEHPNHPEGGGPTVTHWMELHAPGVAQAKEGGV